jgi:hypothetical protein
MVFYSKFLRGDQEKVLGVYFLCSMRLASPPCSARALWREKWSREVKTNACHLSGERSSEAGKPADRPCPTLVSRFWELREASPAGIIRISTKQKPSIMPVDSDLRREVPYEQAVFSLENAFTHPA